MKIVFLEHIHTYIYIYSADSKLEKLNGSLNLFLCLYSIKIC